jgi:hypothetical protein
MSISEQRSHEAPLADEPPDSSAARLEGGGRWWRAFMIGPDHAPGDELPDGRMATLLSWPVRLILVCGAALVGEALDGLSLLEDNAIVLSVFRMNDVPLTHALWFTAHLTPTTAPSRCGTWWSCKRPSASSGSRTRRSILNRPTRTL